MHSVQFSSVAQLCLTLFSPMDCRMSGFPIHQQSWSSLRLMSVESGMPSNHLIFCQNELFLSLKKISCFAVRPQEGDWGKKSWLMGILRYFSFIHSSVNNWMPTRCHALFYVLWIYQCTKQLCVCLWYGESSCSLLTKHWGYVWVEDRP